MRKKFKEREPLHLFTVLDTDTIAARDVDDADDGGKHQRVTKPAGEWARESGRGFVASTEW